MTIRLKLFVAFVGTALLPLAVMGTLSFLSIQKMFVSNVNERITGMAELQRSHFLLHGDEGPLSQKNIDRIATERSSLGETGETLVIGRNELGEAVLMSSRRFDSPLATPMVLTGADLDPASALGLSGQRVPMTQVVDYRGKEVYAVSVPLEENRWGIVVKIDREEVMRPLRTLLLDFVLIGLIFTVLAVAFIAILVTQSVIAPIRDLTEVTQAISMGNLRVSIDSDMLASKDEIGDLSRAFDRTVISLKLAMSETGKELEKGGRNVIRKKSE